MKYIRQFSLIFFFAVLGISNAWAGTSFLVRHIDINGLQRVSRSTVLSYLPVQVGERYRPGDGGRILRSLYETDFFKDVRLGRRKNTLVISVKERPIIGLIQITGNKKIKTKKLKPVLRKLGIVEGSVFNSAKLNEIKQGLMQEYDFLGHYAAKIKTVVTQEPRNRVAIAIHVTEGPVAIVRRIRIIGSHAFSEHHLVKTFSLTTPGLLTFFTHTDRYSKVKLEKDLAHLESYYYNRGYLQFHIVSQKVNISSDHESVYITIHISEGPVFTISGYKIDAPEHIANNPGVKKLITLHTGDTFSRKKVLKINSDIGHFFADNGYAFPKIQVLPRLNDKNHTVFLVFRIRSGHLVYVKHIYIFGNNETKDKVIRRDMHQLEGGLFSLVAIKESKRRIANLPYLRHISIVPVPVAGNPDAVNLDVHVKEVNAGRASVHGGYGTTEGFLYGASVSEPNFMGTGNYVSLAFQRSQISTQYSFSYINPFVTVSGVSRGISLFYNSTRSNRKSHNIDNSYDVDTFGANLFYGLPVSNFDTISLGAGYEHLVVDNVNLARLAPSVLGFLITHGFNPLDPKAVSFNQFNFTLSWTHSSLDRAVFPTSGDLQKMTAELGAPVFSSSLAYYKLVYHGIWFFPLGHGFIISPHTELGYGNGYASDPQYPFFYNFYAGGINTLPGYAPNSLGPKNLSNSNTALGGNLEILGGISFIFPNFISDKVRTAIIVNAGNIFETQRVPTLPPGVILGTQTPPEQIAFKNLRASAGIEISWYSPIGLLHFSVAAALNKRRLDDTQVFGFSFGTSL